VLLFRAVSPIAAPDVFVVHVFDEITAALTVGAVVFNVTSLLPLLCIRWRRGFFVTV